MLSKQWSSNTIKDGVGLLNSQCTGGPASLGQLDEMIKVPRHTLEVVFAERSPFFRDYCTIT